MEIFRDYITRWGLVVDGEPFTTHCSDLLPVCRDGRPAMLKIARDADERAAGSVMEWWKGDGAARVLARNEEALLLERATGTNSLSSMVSAGQDTDASIIICTVAARLHKPRPEPRPDLVALSDWFRDLSPAARRFGGVLTTSADIAEFLLNNPQEITVLHGDLHHENVLDTGDRGWVAIDPKRLIGERGFDFANIFCNPNKAIATAPGRLKRQVEVVAQAARLDRTRLLQWITAYAGLSAAWILNDGDDASLPLTVASMAAQELAAS